MSISARKLGICLILFAILLFHGLNNHYILTKSRYCLGLDAQSFLRRTIEISQIIGEIKPDLKTLYKVYTVIFREHFKPPLFFLTASPFLWFGIDKNAVIMSNIIYFGILLFATYGIGSKLYDYKVGLLAAFLVSMFPTVFAISRLLMIDFSLAAMVALTFYLFVLNRFDNWKFSVLTGIVMGLGSLTKQSYFIFLLPILSYFFLQKENLRNKKIVTNFFLSVIIGLLISSAYYLISHYNYYFVVFQTQYKMSAFFYLYSIMDRQLLAVFFILFLASLVFHIKKKKFFLTTMVVIILIFFSLFSVKGDRFILPVFPYIAVMISGFVRSSLKFRNLFTVILVLFSILQYCIVSYGNVLPVVNNLFERSSLVLYKEMLSDYGLFSLVDEGDWDGPAGEIIKDINDAIKKKGGGAKANIMLIVQDRKIEATIRYLLTVNKAPAEISRTHIDIDFLSRSSEMAIRKDFNNEIMDSDIIVIEKILPEKAWINTGHLLKAFKQNINNFKFIKSIQFPEGRLVSVYKNVIQPG